MNSPWKIKLRKAFEDSLNRSLKSWTTLEQQFQQEYLNDGDHLVKAGEVWRKVCFVLDGLIRVYYIDQSGNELTQHFYQEGEILSPLEDPKGNSCLFYIQSLGESNIATADYSALNKMNINNQEWTSLELHYLKKIFLKNAKREAQLLIGNAESRYSWFCREYPMLLDELSQNQIASFLGVSSVTISRIKNNYSATKPQN